MTLSQSLEEIGVSCLIHQGAQFAGVGELNAKQPTASGRVLVDEARRRLDLGIHRAGARDGAHRDGPVGPWPEPAGCHDPDRQPFGRNYFGSFARRRTAVRPNAYALTVWAIRERVLNPLSPGKAALDASALLNRPRESGFDRVYRLIEFMPVKAKARLEP